MRAREWAMVFTLAAAQALLLACTAWDKSDTADEPTYLGSAALQFVHHDFSTIRHAPVPKWGFGWGLFLADPSLGDLPPNPRSAGRRSVGAWKTAAARVLWSRPLPQLRRNLFAARLATILTTVAAGLWLWRVGRRFGVLCGLLCHALWCLSPSVLAHGSLATLDAWAASFLCVCLWTIVRFVEAPGWRSAAGVGVALGLELGTKAVALLALPVLVAVIVAVVPRGRGARSASLSVLLLGAALTLWAVYLFDLGTVNTWRLHDVYGWPRWRLGPLPFPRWFEGVFFQAVLGSAGRRSYLFGEVGHQGWAWFYLACIALKTTLAAQALAVVAGVAAVARIPRRGGWRVDVALLAFPLLLLVGLSLGHNQAGMRYALPAFPFAILWLARGTAAAVEHWRGWTRAGLALTLCAGAVEGLRLHPHHLMFFNLWAGGPEGGPRYLILSDDWGQDQRRVAAFQRERGIRQIYYTPYSARPWRWGIRFALPPCTPTVGVYALQAIEVHRPRVVEPGCLDWLTVEPPDERLGYSVYVYSVDEARRARLASGRGHPRPFFASGAPTAGPAAAPGADEPAEE